MPREGKKQRVVPLGDQISPEGVRVSKRGVRGAAPCIYTSLGYFFGKFFLKVFLYVLSGDFWFSSKGEIYMSIRDCMDEISGEKKIRVECCRKFWPYMCLLAVSKALGGLVLQNRWKNHGCVFSKR